MVGRNDDEARQSDAEHSDLWSYYSGGHFQNEGYEWCWHGQHGRISAAHETNRMRRAIQQILISTKNRLGVDCEAVRANRAN
eukprot:6172213-Pleurochrysis_carterae.AAC.1